MKKISLYMLVISLLAQLMFSVNVEALRSGNWGYYLLEDGTAEIAGYAGESGEKLVIPSEIDGYKVKKISRWKPDDMQFETIVLPEGLEIIGEDAFVYMRKLKNINIPSTVKHIGRNAFYKCESLESEIVIPEGVEEVGEFAFSDCYSLKKVTIPGSCIGSYMFASCESLTDVTIGDKITSIPLGAFAGCESLKEITIPENITEIGMIAFQYTALENVIIPESVEYLDYGVFSDCDDLKEVIFKNPNTIFEEEGWAYRGPGLGVDITFGTKNAITTVYTPINSQAEEVFSAKGIPVVPVVKVEVNGEEVKTDVPPILLEGRVLIPARAMFEALGAQIGWEENTRTVTAMTSEKNVAMQIDNTQMSVNGLTTELDVAPRILINRTLVPARAISESLGATVEWDEERQTVVVTY